MSGSADQRTMRYLHASGERSVVLTIFRSPGQSSKQVEQTQMRRQTSLARSPLGRNVFVNVPRGQAPAGWVTPAQPPKVRRLSAGSNRKRMDHRGRARSIGARNVPRAFPDAGRRHLQARCQPRANRPVSVPSRRRDSSARPRQCDHSCPADGAADRRLGIVFRHPKTRLSRRAIALSPDAVAALRTHRVRQAEARLLAGSAYGDLDLVFATGIGTPIKPGNLRRS